MGLLSREVYKGGRTYPSEEALEEGMIRQAWVSMSQGQASSRYDGRRLFSQLAAGMPGHLLECIAKRGDHIKIGAA